MTGGMVRLIFVRHGEAAIDPSSYPDHDTMPLSSYGWRQAHAAGRRIAKVRPSTIISSPYLRALQTAQIISRYCGRPVRIDRRFRERVFPPLYGLKYSTLKREHGVAFALALERGNADSLVLPGTDSLEACIERVTKAVDDVACENDGGRVVVVSHGGPHDWLLQRKLGLMSLRPFTRLFTIATGHHSEFDLSSKNGTVLKVYSLNSAP